MADNYQLKAILSAVDKLTPVLKSVQSTAKATRGHIDQIGGALGTLRDSIGVPAALLGGLTAALSVEGIRRAVLGFTDLAGAIADNAKRVGVSTDEYQRLQYMATLSGTSIESLSGAMGKLNKNMGEAVTGKDKDVAALFRRAGITLKDANGNMKNASDILPQVAELFKLNTDAVTRSRIGNALFGKSWAEIVPLLEDGKGGIEKLSKRFDELGIKIGGDAISAAEEFGDTLDELTMVARSYGNEIGAKLVPVLKPMADQLIKWAVANREVIATRAAEWVADFAKTVRDFDWSGLLNATRATVDGIRDFVEWIGGAKNALIALAVVMNLQSIAALFQLARGLLGLGVSLVGIAVKAWSGAAGMLGLAAGTDAAAASSLTLNGRLATLLGTVGALAIAAAPLAAMWGVKEWAEDTSNDTGRVDALRGAGDSAGGFLSWFGFNKNSDIEARRNANRAGLISQPEVRMGGEVKITVDAPPGTRVEQRSDNPAVPFRLDLGQNPFSLGIPR